MSLACSWRPHPFRAPTPPPDPGPSASALVAHPPPPTLPSPPPTRPPRPQTPLPPIPPATAQGSQLALLLTPSQGPESCVRSLFGGVGWFGWAGALVVELEASVATRSPPCWPTPPPQPHPTPPTPPHPTPPQPLYPQSPHPLHHLGIHPGVLRESPVPTATSAEHGIRQGSTGLLAVWGAYPEGSEWVTPARGRGAGLRLAYS